MPLLLEFYGESCWWLLNGTIDKAFFILDAKTPEHRMTPCAIILFIQQSCNEYKPG